MSDLRPQQGELTGAVEVARYTEYADAQRAVDALSDDGFPVAQLRIVAAGLRLVEQVTGRLTTAGAAGRGAGSGALFGAFLGAVLGAFAFVDPLAAIWITALYGAVIGAVFGAIFGAAGHAMQRGRRDFGTVASMQADEYRVLAQPEVAEDARRRLGSQSL